VQVHGFVDPETVMLREGASPGDSIYVTGSLGGAGAALKLLIDGADEIPDELRELLEKPEPRVEQGKQLVSLASACIDISDGLAGDLQHILDASGCGAAVELESIPLSSATRSYMQAHNEWQLPLVAGDDYELLFTVSPDKTAELERLLPDIGCDVTRIGTIDIQAGLRFVDGNGALREPGHAFDHFIDND
jgi:thiamine-monophosphate kinase